jgi:hypothetical protein
VIGNDNTDRFLACQIKGEFRVVKGLSKVSGMGWCHADSTLDISQDVWARLLGEDPSIVKWATTPFPLFDKMDALVGKIIASAEDTFDPTQPPPPPVSSTLATSETGDFDDSGFPGSPIGSQFQDKGDNETGLQVCKVLDR